MSAFFHGLKSLRHLLKNEGIAQQLIGSKKHLHIGCATRLPR
jgi:hypothetical protein